MKKVVSNLARVIGQKNIFGYFNPTELLTACLSIFVIFVDYFTGIWLGSGLMADLNYLY